MYGDLGRVRAGGSADAARRLAHSPRAGFDRQFAGPDRGVRQLQQRRARGGVADLAAVAADCKRPNAQGCKRVIERLNGDGAVVERDSHRSAGRGAPVASRKGATIAALGVGIDQVVVHQIKA